MFVCCECCVLSCRGLCDELITRPEESYRLWCVVVCDLETSRMRRPWPALGRSATAKKKISLIEERGRNSTFLQICISEIITPTLVNSKQGQSEIKQCVFARSVSCDKWKKAMGKGIISAQSHAHVLNQETTQDSGTSQIFALFGKVKCDTRNVSQSPNNGSSHWCWLWFIVPTTTQV